jgi:hypothetical protein
VSSAARAGMADRVTLPIHRHISLCFAPTADDRLVAQFVKCLGKPLSMPELPPVIKMVLPCIFVEDLPACFMVRSMTWKRVELFQQDAMLHVPWPEGSAPCN